MPVPDLFLQGIARGWEVLDASEFDRERTFEADVIIIGTGAGGGTSAEILAERGLKVLLVEEGSLKTSSDFKNDEAKAYAELYQEGAARATQDGGIGILQGRTVGGTTTVNWTSSFRTPDQTLAHWAQAHGVTGLDKQSMAPWFARMEDRLGVEPWVIPPNANNDVIRSGCESLGWHSAVIPRNVRGCWNLGYCGTGCPTNAKQSMLVTTLPAALERGAILIHRARAEQLVFAGDRVSEVLCRGMNPQLTQASGQRIRLRGRHVILAGGAINSPALLLRSGAPDPHQRTGKRTFLHPVNFAVAQFDKPINGFYGAPQSIYSDQFQWNQGTTGPIGFKLEVPPMQPSITSALLGGHGSESLARVNKLSHSNIMIALMRDGFHEQSQGGEVILRDDQSAVLDYPLNDYLWDGARRAFLAMGEIQFAAGATAVAPSHSHGRLSNSYAEYREQIENLSYAIHDVRLASAHVMGGCAMGDDLTLAVTNSLGRHHQVENLSIFDGSLFPTSIGANPQLSIYGLVARLATGLASELSGPRTEPNV
ncbi:MAG TPA: GMC family oxidoreductase [Pseudomonas xinjiangensis]|uniref:GMC family oxidoreductase n=2 Tax=root TaxID=1 RepID=A0A7V1FR11_9GAMM|nr:GMC family oxidoreductase [Halopseudomonas xinjiangensis]HEC49310.1 GMC family oxidoreductase [Halopseudomonas xinjiangensis]